MACTEPWATAQEFADFWGITSMGYEREEMINRFLTIVAADIHAALAASGGCDCSLAEWGAVLLMKLNVVEAGVFYGNPCGIGIKEDERDMFLNWINEQLALIREGKLELCAGETGIETAVLDWAETSHTEFNAARRVWNDMLRRRIV